MGKIKVQKLKGFRDFYSDELRNRKKVFKVFSDTFEKYGFEPLETPALESYDLLTDKYGEEQKLVYNFKDFGDRHVALKYDLTVPTARFFVENQNDLKLPWRRSQIQPVWRADNTQKGRFREFYQCDADIIGVESMVAEVEYILMGIEILEKLRFKKFIVRINNRKILNALARFVNREDKFNDIIYAIDKWDKRTPDKTQEDLFNRGLSNDEAFKLVTLVQEVLKAKPQDKLNILKSKIYNIEEGKEGIEELEFIFKNVDSERVVFDLSIARGLSYYTGPIWEWNILEGDIGSVGGCGRFDKLIGSLTGRDVPATGGSFGIERIIEVMNNQNMFENEVKFNKKNKVLITIFDKEYFKSSLEVTKTLRDNGIVCELYPDIVSIKKQFEYANNKNFDYIVILGEEEINSGKVSLKDLDTGVQEQISISEAIIKITN